MLNKKMNKEINSISYWVSIAATSIVAVFLMLIFSFLMAKSIDVTVFKRDKISELAIVIPLLIIVLIIRSIISYLYDYLGKEFGLKIKKKIRKNIFDSFIKLGPIGLREKKTAELVFKTSDAPDKIEPYYSDFLPHFISVCASTLIILCFIFATDWLSGIVMMLTAPLVPLFMFLIGRTSEFVNKRAWSTMEEMGNKFLELLKGMNTLKLFNKSKTRRLYLNEVNEKFRKNTMSVLRVTFLTSFIMEFITTMSTAMVAVFLAVRLIYGQMDFFTAFLVLLIIPEYFQPIKLLGQKYHISTAAKTAYFQIESIINTEERRETFSENVELSENITISKKEITIKQNAQLHESDKFDRVLIENLSYKYRSGNQVINTLNLEINEPGLYAITGKSGVGKTTLNMLLLGFDRNYNGNIKLGNYEVSSLHQTEMNKRISYVSQNPFLFKGTVFQNITIGILDKNYSFETIESLLIKFDLSAFINRLSDGLKSVIGEGGTQLSGGESQIIAILRAILSKSDIIILDEPTSALDVNLEEKLIKILKEISKDKIIIVTAHRLPTLIAAKKIFYMENGIFTEQGTHDELIATSSKYKMAINGWLGGIYD